MSDSPILVQMLLQSAVIPLAVAFALLAAGRALRLNAAASVLAVTAAFLASFFATLHAQWSLVPHVAMDWMPWIAAGAAGGALAAEQAPDAGRRFALRLATSVAAAALVVWGAVESLGATKAVLAAVLIGLVIAGVWTTKARSADGGARRPLLLAMVAGGTGLALMLDSSQQIGQLSGALAMALGACMLFNLPKSRVAFPPAATGTALVLLGALIANAYLYADFSVGYVALLLVALLADPVLGIVAKGAGRQVDPHWVPAAVLTALPVLATVALVLKAAQEHGGY